MVVAARSIVHATQMSNILPPATPFNIAVTALQLAGVASMAMSERTAPLAYSKFAGAAGNVPSRLGMVIIYLLGLVASLTTLIAACREPNTPRCALRIAD